MAKQGYTDPYAAAQFNSLWKVVVHATDPLPGETVHNTEDRRLALLPVASKAMVLHGKWRGYRMVFSPNKGLHVGFRYAKPTDWFLRSEEDGTVDGPFVSKNRIKAKLGLKRTAKVSPGVYRAGAASGQYTLFIRERAGEVNVQEETLP